nr:CrcB family protein [bacterium]
MALKNLLIVGLGGFVGSVLRYSVSGWVQRLAPEGSFPLGTLAVNVTGCLVLGFLGGLAENLEVFAPGTRVFVFLGVLGGFTTFSSFGYETQAEQYLEADVGQPPQHRPPGTARPGRGHGRLRPVYPGV